jgi:hypothetical protein
VACLLFGSLGPRSRKISDTPRAPALPDWCSWVSCPSFVVRFEFGQDLGHCVLGFPVKNWLVSWSLLVVGWVSTRRPRCTRRNSGLRGGWRQDGRRWLFKPELPQAIQDRGFQHPPLENLVHHRALLIGHLVVPA